MNIPASHPMLSHRVSQHHSARRFAATLLAVCMLLPLAASARKVVFNMSDYGISPDVGPALTANVQRFLNEHLSKVSPSDRPVLKFKAGRYEFYSADAPEREVYVSNHDQTPTKKIIFDLHHLHGAVIDGGGAEFVFHGTVIPFALSYSEDCELRNFSIDFAQPKMTPLTILASSETEGITFSVPEWADAGVSDDGWFYTRGEGWIYRPIAGMAFDTLTSHLVYGLGEFGFSTQGCVQLDAHTFRAPNWRNAGIRPGMVVAARDWTRPTPAIFLSESSRTSLRNVSVHYAHGMGLLAQRCTDITLTRFNVCLRPGSKRYATTQADATHFSQCRGKIISTDGLYEGMMDDAINVHGIYLKVIQRLDDHTLLCAYSHSQAWGFNWGNSGDSVQFIHPRTMEIIGHNRISGIKPHDRIELRGMRVFRISFEQPLGAEINESDGIGVEDLNWMPEVRFARNVVRNNRARGALFSTEKRTVVEKNLFDHVSGTAILLCGDCNGWYESGACRDIVIRRNVFRNCLTNYFQFTNAVISIYPEIPALDEQQQYFHSGVRIERNEFDYFDAPLLYAKSVDGLTFRRNKLVKNTEFPPFHWNQKPILLERVTNEQIEVPEAATRDQ